MEFYGEEIDLTQFLTNYSFEDGETLKITFQGNANFNTADGMDCWYGNLDVSIVIPVVNAPIGSESPSA